MARLGRGYTWGMRIDLFIPCFVDQMAPRVGMAVARVLEPGPSAYSDLAVLPDGTILCFYERGRPGALRPGSRREDWPYARLTLARFPRAWLESGGR